MVWPFATIWGISLEQIIKGGVTGIVSFLPAMFVGIVVHELIHGFTAIQVGRLPWRAIKFGVQWATFTPYCHPTVPMPAQTYRWVVVMPLLVVGLLPYAIALATGSLWLLAFGVFFTLAAAGDLMILWLMRHLQPHALVQDHPTKVGLLVVSSGDSAG